MTQVDSLVEGKSSSSETDTETSCKSSEASQQRVKSDDVSQEVSWSKVIKIYRNGKLGEPHHTITVGVGQRSTNWSDILLLLNETTRVPVLKVFTLKGKRIQSFTDLVNLDEVVVCGSEHFKMLPYSQEQRSISPKDSTSEYPTSKTLTARCKLKNSERACLAKSVILETGCMSESDSEIRHGSPLMKTFSEQDVSIMEKSSSPKIRIRQSHSPKPRPVSAYQQGNMTTSTERRFGIGASVSRIPKRIISSPICSSNNPSPSPILRSSMNVPKSKKADIKTPLAEKTNRQDSSRREFIRPRLVTVIRHGMKPRKAVRFLLNKKTARSYDQVLNELTESIKPDWGAVRKVYTLNGTEVACLEDFFGNDDIFVACPNDRVGTNDFDLDSEECKSIQPYVKVSLGFKQSKFRGMEASRSPNRRPKSCSNSQQNQSPQYPSHPKYIPLAHFPFAILDKYYVGNVIGDGNFAVVRECTDRLSKQRFALKVIDKSKCKGRDAPPEHEVKILGMVNHPNIIEMYEQYDFTNELYIVLELIEGGDLFDAIAEVTKFSEKDSASMTRDIASALGFLHSHRIIHRDIKPENLLVYTQTDGRRCIKLGDFGLAQIVEGPLYTVCGTPTYVAPEILAESGYGLKVDIWALGVIVYVLLCGYPPFVSPTGEQADLFDLILSAEYDFPDEHWESISNEAKDIVTRMIEPDPDMRLCADEVLNHPWLAKTPAESQERKSRFKDDFNFRVFEAMGLNLPIPPSTKLVSSTNVITS